ncbi:MAG: cell division protein FtsQ/DivIB [Hyphomonadaceae bacterium]
MSKVRNSKSGGAKGKRGARSEVIGDREQVQASSILFGLAILTALIVAAAAWMGGSLSQLERRVGHMLDSAARSTGLAVQYVSVEGVTEEIADELRFAALIEPGENMFRADPYLVRERIEATGRVVNVQVHRFWPDHILVLADAVEPVALWNSDGRGTWAVVDGLGRVMADPSEDTSGLVRVAGAGADTAAPDLAIALHEFPDLAARVSHARRVSEERWDLKFDSGIVANLPRDASQGPAIRRLAFLDRDTEILDRPLRRIDMRHAEQVFMSPERPATAALEADAG